MKFNFEKALTLIELLVVVAIIILLTVMVSSYYHFGQAQYALQRSAHKLAQDIRGAQAMTMSGKVYECETGTLKGYGIELKEGENHYLLKARCEEGDYEEDEVLEDGEIKLEKKVVIKELTFGDVSTSSLEVFFYPPNPKVDLGGAVEGVEILLGLEDNDEYKGRVEVNKAGLITANFCKE